MGWWSPSGGIKNIVRNRIIKDFLVFATALLVLGSVARCVEAKTHYLLLDASLSMKERYANNIRGWLFEPLLRSGAFLPDDRVIVRWFHQRGSLEFDPKDPLRVYDGRHDVQVVLSHVPGAQQAIGKNTDILEGLQLALQDLEKLKVTDETLIWLITDNVQDIGGGGSVDPLYEKIKVDSNFQAAYIFPLTNENHAKLPPDRDAMVLYLLQYSKKPSRPGLAGIADDAGRRIGNVPVTWFPIDKGIELNETDIRVNNESSTLVDGKLTLPDVPEGTQPQFTIQFPFQSKLRNLKIAQSRITPQPSSMSLPSDVVAEGEVDSWRGNITPTDLTLEPGKRSALYTTTLSGDMLMRPASFWNAVWNSTSEPVEVLFAYKLMDVETQMDLSAINQVRNLRGIENNVRQSEKRLSSATIPMSFHVQFNSLWRRILVGAIALALIALLAGGVSLFLIKSRYQLSTPFGEEQISLPIVGRRYVTINGDHAAVIKRTFGSLSVSPLGNYSINGTLKSQALNDSMSNFDVENQTDNKHYFYTLSRSTNSSGAAVNHDSFLD